MLYFIQRLRDEAHRFVIGSHRKLRKKDIREAGRNTQGVKLINLNAGDKLTAIARVISESDEPEAPEAGLSI